MSHTVDDRGKKVNSVVDFPSSKSIERQASEWLAKLDAEAPSREDLKAFEQWINKDAAHRQAFESQITFWDDQNILTQVVFPREETVQQSTVKYRSSFIWSRQRLAVSGFALLMLIISVVLLAPQFLTPSPVIYTTKIGEQKTIELPDHTTIFLNTNSQLKIDYDKQRRGVILKRGEAYFDVFHDPQRPFEVYAGNRLVRAIGTAFTVHLRKVNVEVIVTEGVVEIDAVAPIETGITFAEPQGMLDNIWKDRANSMKPPEIPPPIAAVKIKAGNIAMYDRKTLDEVKLQVKLMVAQQIEEKLSWRQGLLIFKGEPLEQVVEEVCRYTSLKIIIPERKNRELKVGGLFKLGDTESLFEALQEGFGIHVEKISDNMVYLISSENR